ncbi:uncharacterized protein LOC143546967 [Bidens hawaiensis]|uniref:uncharacterized protein LOC143546967 n=1 Tax=Bidens hawaiensis TaxID=980011 RepID=UPI00404A7CC1
MNRHIRSQSAAVKSDNNNYLRYLKPGALAQLRDSKINARSPLRSPDYQICFHRATPSSPITSPSRSFNAAGGVVQHHQQQEVAGGLTVSDGELPFVSVRFSASRCLQRKKLMAVRSMCSLASDGSVAVIDVL